MNKKVVIAIAGFGNIGSNFYKLLEKTKVSVITQTGKTPIVKYISAKNFRKKRLVRIPKSKWIKDPLKFPKMKDIDIIIELIGGADGIAKKLVFSSLKNKKHVITANKALIAKYGNELASLAEINNVNLEYEASVAGGIPIIRSIKESLIGNKIDKIYGILNGTTNFILSSMESKGKDFSEVLSIAKKLGYAETNPKSDLNGDDSAAKIKILSSLVFKSTITKNYILTEGIQNITLKDITYAKTLGYKIKLLSISEIIEKKIIERVHPCLISSNSYLGNIDGVLNAVVIEGKPVGKVVLQGEGAGSGPTSSALISDLCSVLRGNIKLPFGISYKKKKKLTKFDILKHASSSYLRIEVQDLPGVLSSITKIFAKNRISIKNLIQNPDKKNKKASIVIITYKNLEKNYKNLFLNLVKNKFVLKKPIFIRIENL